MRDLTTADIAFLLCTSKRGSFRFSLSTNFGLLLDIGASGTVTASLDKPGEAKSGRLQSIAPPSPICDSAIGSSIDAIMLTPTSTVAPSFSTSFSFTSPYIQLGRPTDSTTTPRTPIQRTSSSTRKFRQPPTIITSRLTTTPTPTPTPTPSTTSTTTSPQSQGLTPGYKYLITPNYSSSTTTTTTPRPSLTSTSSSYIFYAPNWPYNPRSTALSSLSTPQSPKPITAIYELVVREEDLEARYCSIWLSSYLDWVHRSKRAADKLKRKEEKLARQGYKSQTLMERGVYGRSGGPFVDEGERTLWMVEGLLLAAWLCLQGDCDSVEYAPYGSGGEDGKVYVLERDNVGRVIQGFLGGVRA